MKLVDYLRENIGRPLDHAMAVQIMILVDAQNINPLDLSVFPSHSYGRVTFQAERLADVVEEIKPLHFAHWRETEYYRHGTGLDFDYDGTIRSEMAGRYILFTARLDGRMVGDCGVYLNTSRHTGKPYASEDALFMLPEARKGLTAVAFVRYAERILERLGMTEIQIGVKTINQAGALMQKIGYEHVGDLLVKQLGKKREAPINETETAL